MEILHGSRTLINYILVITLTRTNEGIIKGGDVGKADPASMFRVALQVN
jgi:hypothetical protein